MNQSFPVKDLLRRRFQTTLVVLTMTLSVASTLFLLFFSGRIGSGIAGSSGTLTLGLSTVFAQFINFIGSLIFVIGAVLTSFIIFLMMAQRTRDFGLIKAAGCPNALLGGYFMAELLIVTLLGCGLGIIFGFIADYAAANLVFHGYVLPNLWFIPLVFGVFFGLALAFGVQPILKAAKMSPINALSPVTYYGMIAEKKHKPLSRRGITWKISTRSLGRRQSANVRLVVLLSAVFVLLTVSVAGGIIASDTTRAWIVDPYGKNTLLIAHSNMAEEYPRLVSAFSGIQTNQNFNFSSPDLAISQTILTQLEGLDGVSGVDSQLILKMHVNEVSNFTIDPDTLTTYSVGDNRESDTIIIGLNQTTTVNDRSIKGRFLTNNAQEAVIGDTVARTMYGVDPQKGIYISDPLLQSIRIHNNTLKITGMIVDPFNNGNVTYIPLSKLEEISGVFIPNLAVITLKDGADPNTITAEIQDKLQVLNSYLTVFNVNAQVAENQAFLDATWQVIMLLPLMTLASAALCLVGYSILSVDEQRQEFGILRAIGTKPSMTVSILSIQGIILLFSSFGVGISFGTIITLMILITNPLVTRLTIFEIFVWLFSALIVMFLLSIYPAVKMSKTPLLKILA
jgi:ABC-type antimicrobial peptide transport system permease subunit